MFFKRKWKIPQPQKQVNFDFNGSVETFGSESESLVHGSHRRCPVEPAIPDEALFLALGYLQFMGLLTVRMVCKSLRDAVDGDALLWCHLLSECPLSLKVTDVPPAVGVPLELEGHRFHPLGLGLQGQGDAGIIGFD
ncbi:hypothetical protein AAC387_Pa09g2405 [Persea americana]